MSNLEFDPAASGPVFGPLLAIERLPDLGPGRADERYRSAIGAATKTGFAHANVRQGLAAKAFFAGLWLMFDFLDESHDISQSLPDEWGAYWHGVMHRREPDAGNSAYWFRRVRTNPIDSQLRAAAIELDYDYRGPITFIQDCEQSRGTGGDEEARLRNVQLAEIRLLLSSDFQNAVENRRQS